MPPAQENAQIDWSNPTAVKDMFRKSLDLSDGSTFRSIMIHVDVQIDSRVLSCPAGPRRDKEIKSLVNKIHHTALPGFLSVHTIEEDTRKIRLRLLKRYITAFVLAKTTTRDPQDDGNPSSGSSDEGLGFQKEPGSEDDSEDSESEAELNAYINRNLPDARDASEELDVPEEDEEPARAISPGTLARMKAAYASRKHRGTPYPTAARRSAASRLDTPSDEDMPDIQTSSVPTREPQRRSPVDTVRNPQRASGISPATDIESDFPADRGGLTDTDTDFDLGEKFTSPEPMPVAMDVEMTVSNSTPNQATPESAVASISGSSDLTDPVLALLRDYCPNASAFTAQMPSHVQVQQIRAAIVAAGVQTEIHIIALAQWNPADLQMFVRRYGLGLGNPSFETWVLRGFQEVLTELNS
ncbi:hypothetical protein MKEN_00119400 [Mycena kentingensis (nom. inval.)]|nr:hypothetical protein MKEN_00119400 [Mycena kentingensis (nom. inval.)]